MSAIASSTAKVKGNGSKGRKGQKAEGRRAGALVTPHVYGFKRYVWGETFRFGYDEATANARCLRLLALKATLEGQGVSSWDAETKAKAWKIAKGADEAPAAQPSAPTTAPSSPSNASEALRTLSYESTPSAATEAPEGKGKASTSPMLYDVFDAYLAHVKATGGKSDHTFANRIRGQRRAIANMPLEDVGAKELTRLVAFWKSKPIGQRNVYDHAKKQWHNVETNEPIGALTVRGYVGAARQMFKWIASEESGYAWEAPNLQTIFQFRSQDFERLKGVAERQAEVKAKNKGEAARHFSIDELKALWNAASKPSRKLYFLLALNCACSTSELANLRVGDCYLDGDNAAKPFIAFIRNKTRRFGCYGKWFLWQETAERLRKAIAGKAHDTDLVFTTDEGNPLVSLSEAGNRCDSVKMVWQRWSATAKVTRLPWKNMRKTSSQLVREAATTMGLNGKYMQYIHLAHGDDAMTKAYNNPSDLEYEQLGQVLADVRKRLAPVFEVSKPTKEQLEERAALAQERFKARKAKQAQRKEQNAEAAK